MTDKPNTASKVFGIGTVVIDHVAVLDQFPERDTKNSIRHHWRQIGGPVPVALSVAQFYGVSTAFSGRWGEDVDGREVRAGLAGRGIDLTHSHSDTSWSTGFAQVWTEERHGSRTIAFSRGEFAVPTENDLAECSELLQQCNLLHVDGSSCEFAIAAAKAMRSQGGRVALDAGSKKPGMEDLLPHVDVLVASDLFCGHWFGNSNAGKEELCSLGCPAVFRTKGAEGAHYWDASVDLFLPAEPIDAIDTNGAGDIFAGAVLVGLARGWTMKQTLQFAVKVAGYACGHRGNSTWPELDLDDFDQTVAN